MILNFMICCFYKGKGSLGVKAALEGKLCFFVFFYLYFIFLSWLCERVKGPNCYRFLGLDLFRPLVPVCSALFAARRLVSCLEI